MIIQVGAQDHAAPVSASMRLTTTWFKLLGAAIAIISMTLEATPSDLTPGQPSADWVQSYGERNKDCLEWTDTCVNCVRTQSGENSSCSNIGIACQPKQVTCVRSTDDKAKWLSLRTQSSALPQKRTLTDGITKSALCQKRTSQSLNRSPGWRRYVDDYSRERYEELQCDSRNATFTAANKAEAVSAECNLLVWIGIFTALFLGILQAT